jgi:hypothetical protein
MSIQYTVYDHAGAEVKQQDGNPCYSFQLAKNLAVQQPIAKIVSSSPMLRPVVVFEHPAGTQHLCVGGTHDSTHFCNHQETPC